MQAARVIIEGEFIVAAFNALPVFWAEWSQFREMFCQLKAKFSSQFLLFENDWDPFPFDA